MKTVRLLIVFAFLSTALGACRFGPPASCGENIGGVADEALFGQYFESMELVSATTWQPGTPGEQGVDFSIDEPLLIMFDAKSDVTIRACIQVPGRGNLALNETQSFSEGSNEFNLGAFAKGSYIMRVIVDETLVKNFPFSVK